MMSEIRDRCGRGSEMFDYDVCVIGGGILGCMAARELARFRIRVALVEKREDVCTGISKANTAVVYAGYDNRPGTLKQQMCVQGNAEFGELCRQLGVRLKRCGSLMVSFGDKGTETLERKLRQGQTSGVPGLRLLGREQVLELEPNLNPAVKKGLYAPTTATVNPWELGIAAFENAKANGCEVLLLTQVTAIRRLEEGFLVELLSKRKTREVLSESNTRQIRVRGILNCAGLYADQIYELVFPPKVRIFPQQADYFVFDECWGGFLNHIVFYEPEDGGKGLTLVPTVDGNLLAGPSGQKDGSRTGFETSREGLDFLRAMCRTVVPGLPLESVIRNFGSIRPNPYEVEPDGAGGWRKKEKGIHSFVIEQEKDCPSMISLIGIKTPGITCSAKLAQYAAGKLLEALDIPAGKKSGTVFCPERPAPVRIREMSAGEYQKYVEQNPAYGKIVCRCRMVTEGEIRDAIRRGAVTVDGVKRRCGAGMGRCQGGWCRQQVTELLSAELGVPPEQIQKDGPGSYLYNVC